MKDKHVMFMEMALEESKKALPECLPNPPVGCILVENNKIVGAGYTRKPGEGHAEAIALKGYSGSFNNVEVYITLEPCSFDGRTPSCAQLIASKKINRVYIALRDTHPRNNGAGIEILKEAGIEVIEGILKEEVKRFINQYLIKGKI